MPGILGDAGRAPKPVVDPLSLMNASFQGPLPQRPPLMHIVPSLPERPAPFVPPAITDTGFGEGRDYRDWLYTRHGTPPAIDDMAAPFQPGTTPPPPDTPGTVMPGTDTSTISGPIPGVGAFTGWFRMPDGGLKDPDGNIYPRGVRPPNFPQY